jgi:putative membrane-bound dehydrogenase-like protein
VNAYSNDVPCYIPSERVLKEGGYEGGGAMVFYGLPAPFAPGLEDKIIAVASAQLGDDFKRPRKTPGTQGSLPKSPAESLATIKVPDGLRVELVACEPLVESPVAIDFGPDGKLWIAEMRDYGCKDGETCAPNGRVSVLEDRDADGTFETAAVFLDKIAQPMGVTVWRNGVLISAAPDLIYAEDTNGDGKADNVQKLFTGFSVENPQARLNSLAVGLDGWLHAGCMFVGKLRSIDGREFTPGNRDFRLRPDTREIESENGQTENARVRDDWGNWFGCENGKLCLHYPLADRYLRRNKYLSPPQLDISVPTPAAAKLIPRGQIVLLPLSGPAGKATAACGLTFYRDESLGPQFAGNAFTCEPVHQLIHRLVLKPRGATFVGERADSEAQSEFLASTDNWFRPVQARTGPDGALWIVDMYRYVIEHSRWIPPEMQAELDVYAGSARGRIYRVLPKDAKLQPLPRIDQLSAADLAAAMDSPNGTQRDMIQQQLVWRNASEAAAPLAHIVTNSQRPAARLQALCTLDLLGKLDDDLLETALHDPRASVRRQAVRLAEPRFKSSPQLLAAALALADDADPFVAQQLACSLGQTDDPQRIRALVSITQRHKADPYVTTCVWSSLSGDALGSYFRLLVHEAELPPLVTLARLFELIGAAAGSNEVNLALNLASSFDKPLARLELLQATLDGLRRNPRRSEVLSEGLVLELTQLGDAYMRMADDEQAAIATRARCLRIVGQMPRLSRSVAAALPGYLNPAHDAELQRAAIDALAEQQRPDLAAVLIGGWRSFTPALRAHVLDVLLTRKEWVGGLLGAIQSSSIAASEIDVAHRTRLTDYPDAEIRQKAAAIFAQGGSSSRAEVVAKYQRALQPGDAARGKAVFQKNCAACHKVRDIGTQVGPDIAARQDKSNEGLLREILDPNRALDQRYADYTAVTTDGVVKNGVLTEDAGGAIKLRTQEGQETRLLRSELECLTSSGKSLMPEGFENQITPAEMSDLVSFLAAP